MHLEPDEPLPMSALAGALQCDNSNVTGIVDRLEAAGLAERRAAERDRRVKTVVLTPHGEAVSGRGAAARGHAAAGDRPALRGGRGDAPRDPAARPRRPR